MTKLPLLGLALVAGLALAAGPVLAQDDGDKPAPPQQSTAVPGPPPSGPMSNVKVGFLELKNDVRYHPQYAYTRIQIAPALHPVEGARIAIADMKIITDTANVQLSLDEQQANDAKDAIAKLQAMAAGGERFAILDLPGDIVAQVGPALANTKLTLLNATAPQDALREMCMPNMLHVAASDRMLGDSYAQFLRHRNWLKVLLLQGDQPRDKEMADAFQQSADRLGITIAARKQFTLSTDPANRENNDTMLVTGGLDYDVIYIADSLGEYSRKLNYNTLLPRPVIGSTGLTASEWHWSWDQDSATQITLRFQRTSQDHRAMSGYDWDTWMAFKAVATAYAKAHSTNPDKIDAFLKGRRLKLDGSKGLELDFRPWDKQLRMPIVLATSDSTVGTAPFDEFLHEGNELDSLGVDQPESKCQAPQQ